MSDDVPLYIRDPAAYRAHLAQGNATQARKRVSADLLLRDGEGRICLVKPTYKPGWDLVGGMSEANEEPAETAKREVREELRKEITVGRLLCIEWVPPHDEWDDQLALIFDGGVLGDDEIRGIQLLDGELEAIEFCSLGEARARLSARLWRRLDAAVQALDGQPGIYLRDGQPMA